LEVLEKAEPAAAAPWIHLEFDIPRLGRRVDAVLVTSTAVIPIEFKVGAKTFQQCVTGFHDASSRDTPLR